MTGSGADAEEHASWCAEDSHGSLDRCQSDPVAVGRCLLWLEQPDLDAEPIIVVGSPEYGAELSLAQVDELCETLTALRARARARPAEELSEGRPVDRVQGERGSGWRALAGWVAAVSVAALVAETMVRVVAGDRSPGTLIW